MRGAEQAVVEKWIKERLATKSADFEALSFGLSQRVFDSLADDDAEYPYIIYQCQVPPRDILGVGTFRVMVDTMYIVKAVAQVSSYDPLAPIASVIDSALTSAEGSGVSGGVVFTSVRDKAHSVIEMIEGKQVRNLGGEYAIKAQGF